MTAMIVKAQWQDMTFSRVGNLADVMERKSGPHCDPSPVHTVKRGNGPAHC